MRLIVALAFCLGLTLAARAHYEFTSTSEYSFEEYVRDFQKTYRDDADREAHRAIFERNLAMITAHNRDHTQSFKMGVNQFADLSEQEMKANFGYNSRLASLRRASSPVGDHSRVAPSALPTTVDWRTNNPPVVTPVKNQGACGSCWAFAAVESIESRLALETGKLLTLSPQQVTSCTPNPQHCGGTGGCNGATADLAFDYVQHNGGIATDAAYPYTARTGTCKTDVPKVATISGYRRVAQNNYSDLLTAVATQGPISVSADASSWSFYSSGVFTMCPGQGRDVIINHAIQLVGYGVDGDKPYWIIRNSWGSGWGERGYMRLFRHADGSSQWCNRDPRPEDGSGCDGGPKEVTVCGSCGIWYDNAYVVGAKLL